MSERTSEGLPTIDVNEYGVKKGEERQVMNRRLFMQLLVLDGNHAAQVTKVAADLSRTLTERRVAHVLYADASSPRGIGLLTWNEDPAHFIESVRPVFENENLANTTHRTSFSMLGRTYSNGHEPDLEFNLMRRPVERVMNKEWGWHVWYPLRRTGSFARLDGQEQGALLREHAQIGLAYGAQGLAHDIRLACHALDANDNEFIIGLVGSSLHSLSHLVQTMRRTKQTAEYIEKMGPFFVGRVMHRGG